MTPQEELEFIAECSITARMGKQDVQSFLIDPRFLQLPEAGQNIIYDLRGMASQIKILRDEANWGRR